MNYTFHKRRELNDAFRSYLLDQQINQDKDGGVPVLWVDALPQRACAIESVQHLSNLLPYDERAWQKVVPVFVKVPRMKPKNGQIDFYYIINYVNCSAPSMEQAADLVASGKLFWIPELTINAYGKRGC